MRNLTCLDSLLEAVQLRNLGFFNSADGSDAFGLIHNFANFNFVIHSHHLHRLFHSILEFLMLVVKFTRSVEDLEVCPGDANITLCEMLVKFFLSVNKLANLFLVLLLVSFLEKSSPLVSVVSHAFGSDLHLKLGNGHLNLEELFNCNDSIRATDNFANLVDFNFVAVSSFLVENAIHLLLQFASIFLLCILDPVLNFCVGFFEGHDFWVTVQFVINDLALNVDGGDVVLEEDCVFELALHSFYQS